VERQGDVVVVALAERPELIPGVTEALRREWADWYGREDFTDTLFEFSRRARTDALPMTLVAVDGARLVGAASLVQASIATHAHLTNWIGGLWVTPERRGQGIGAALVEAACDHAKRLGMGDLHAATATAEALFVRAGFERIDTATLDAHPGEPIAVLRKRLT